MPRIHTRRYRFALTLTLCLQISTSMIFAQSVPTPAPAPQSQITAPTPFEELARRLIAAASEAERASMLAEKKELLTAALPKALHAAADREREKGDSAQAFEIYQLAKSIAEQIKDTAGMAAALEEIGLAYYDRGDYDTAMNTLKETLRLQEQLKDVREQAGALNQIGMVHRAKGEYPQAIESYQKAQTLNSTLGDRKVLIQTLVNLGIVYRAQGNYGAALQTYQQALKVQEVLGDKGPLARLFNGIGNVYWSQGNYTQAIEYFQKSLRLAEELKQARVVATLLNNLGEAYASAGDYETALVYYGKSLTLTEASKDKRQLASILSNMGNVERQRGATALALESYQKSLNLREELKDKAGIAEALERIALLRSERGNNAEALPLAERAASIAKEIGKRETFWQARATAGKVYRALKQVPEARGAFAEAIGVIEDLRRQVAGGEENRQRYFEDKVSPYYEMADLLVGENKLDEALRYAERAKARVLLDVLQGGRNDIIKRMTESEQARERKLKDEIVVLNVQVQRESARVQSDKSRLTNLQARLDEARLEYADFQTNLYAAHPDLRVQRGEARIATLMELGKLLPDTNTALLEYMVGADRTLLFVLTKPKKAVEPLSKGNQQRVSGAPVKANDHSPGATPEVHVYPLNIGRGELMRRTERFRKTLANRDILFNEEAQQLYDLLLAPAAAELQTRQRLILAPDAALWDLPFQALRSPHNEYLIERYALSFVPSLSVLGEMIRERERLLSQPANDTLFLAFGNPKLAARDETITPGTSMSSNTAQPNSTPANEAQPSVIQNNSLADLPEAERQVHAIAALYGARRSRVFTGAQANEEQFKREAGNFRILHLATHGVLDDASPLYSYVLLARSTDNVSGNNTAINSVNVSRDSGEDGLLEAWELMRLDLRAEMVVLSACETARGRVGQGEGMIGLSWALFVAGSPTTLASQWKVESASTTELMLNFYRHLSVNSAQGLPRRAAKPETKAEALRQAALLLLRSKTYAHPFYWAGFVIVGDGD
jgi:CHAT domain-containing protein/uncharacterized protein HemY